MQQRSKHSNSNVSETAIQATIRDIKKGVRYPDFWTDRYGDDQEQEDQGKRNDRGQGRKGKRG